MVGIVMVWWALLWSFIMHESCGAQWSRHAPSPADRFGGELDCLRGDFLPLGVDWPDRFPFDWWVTRVSTTRGDLLPFILAIESLADHLTDRARAVRGLGLGKGIGCIAGLHRGVWRGLDELGGLLITAGSLYSLSATNNGVASAARAPRPEGRVLGSKDVSVRSKIESSESTCTGRDSQGVSC